MSRYLISVVVMGFAGACNSAPSLYLDGWSPPAITEGFTRYQLPPILDIASGTDILRCQWLAPPADHDQYITVVAGEQSAGGHHIVLYANKVAEAVGTTRECTTDDMLDISFLGAIGGEGNSTENGAIPAGVAFKVPKGQALMANTHYINATAKSLNGQGVIDAKYVELSAVQNLANLFANVGLNLAIPKDSTTSYDSRCTFTRDLSFFRIANHMHEWGTAVETTITHADGSQQRVSLDDPWSKEKVFNFPFQTYTLDQPLVVHKGDTLVTHCTWHNTAGKDLGFPDEMCVAFGFFLTADGGQISCQDGSWQ